jgi:hypothetical protein
VERRDGAQAVEWQRKGAGVSTAELLHNNRVVRAFNCIGWMSLLNDGNRQPERLAIPIGGDDAAALEIAQRLVRDTGFDPVMVGSLAKTREFDLGQPLAGGQLTAAQLRAKINPRRAVRARGEECQSTGRDVRRELASFLPLPPGRLRNVSPLPTAWATRAIDALAAARKAMHSEEPARVRGPLAGPTRAWEERRDLTPPRGLRRGLFRAQRAPLAERRAARRRPPGWRCGHQAARAVAGGQRPRSHPRPPSKRTRAVAGRSERSSQSLWHS